MAGSMASTRSNHTMDRFYSIPQRRPQPDAQQQRSRPERSRSGGSAAGGVAAQQLAVREVESRVESDDSSSKPSVSSSPCPSPPPSLPSTEGNLSQFIRCTTPLVGARYLSKQKSTKGPRRHDAADQSPYFCLEDLWESFKEWSAYGAGVPLLLNENDIVIQYYVPYLSGLQLYVSSSSSSSKPRHADENNDGEFYRDTSSEGSNGSATDRPSDRIPEANSGRGISERFSRVSLHDKVHASQEGSSSDDGEAQNTQGHLVFEFLERGPPYGREPLVEKVSALAKEFPELKKYRSCDLLPSSWMSVAWYPIYRIPTGPTLRDLDACFLTFHKLAKPSRSVHLNSVPNGLPDLGSSSVWKGSIEKRDKLDLPAFGLASYKFRGSIWTPNGLFEQEQTKLLHSAGEWLQRLQVDHPDFNFFLSRSNTYQR